MISLVRGVWEGVLEGGVITMLLRRANLTCYPTYRETTLRWHKQQAAQRVTAKQNCTVVYCKNIKILQDEIIYVLLRIYYISVVNKSPHPPPITFESIQINKWVSGHVYMTKGGEFWYIRKFHYFPKNRSYRNSNIVSASPYKCVPHFQGIDRKMISQNRDIRGLSRN